MQERMRNVEEFTQYATDMIILMEQDQRRVDESLRRLDESLQRLEESVRRTNESVQQLGESGTRRDETLQRMLQAMAVIKANTARIDQTDGGT